MGFSLKKRYFDEESPQNKHVSDKKTKAIIRRIPGGDKITVEPGMPLKKILKEMGIPRDSVVALKDGHPIPEDTILKAGDEIELISVISGGRL